MRVMPSNPRFGTQLVIDSHPMTRRELEQFTPEARQGLEQARNMLAADGNNDTLTMFYADDMVGYGAKQPNYLGFELNKGGLPETLSVKRLHNLKDPNDVVRVILEAYWNLKKRAR